MKKSQRNAAGTAVPAAAASTANAPAATSPVAAAPTALAPAPPVATASVGSTSSVPPNPPHHRQTTSAASNTTTESVLDAKQRIANRRLRFARTAKSENKPPLGENKPPVENDGKHKKSGKTINKRSVRDGVTTNKTSTRGVEANDTRQSFANAFGSQETRPGAYFVEPSSQFDNPDATEDTTHVDLEIADHAESSSSSMQGPPTTDLFISEAVLVDAEAEQIKREEERNVVREQTRREIQASAAQAEVVDVEAESRKRRRILFGLIAVTLISVAVAITVVLKNDDSDSPTLAPTSRNDAVEDLVIQWFDNEDAVLEASTPQYEAVNWMAVNDTTLSFPPETEDQFATFAQRYAMCVLAFATDYINWDNRHQWLEPNISECQWSGLTCDSRNRLIGINVAINGLNGTLPSELGRLLDLQSFFVFDNPLLKGTLPSELGNSTTLVSLYAQRTGLEGTLPSEFGQLAYLENLDLSENNLSGTIPLEFSRMHHLVDLDLGNNDLNGPIPFTFWRLQRLETLLLNGNRLNSTIPIDFGSMIELERLELQDNVLTGQLPTQLASLDQLQTLDVSRNLLLGSVPAGICDLRAGQLESFMSDCSSLGCTCCTNCT